ncbi:hypothetical protein BJ741DRAFT_602799 [Chytriomyces cf. hyalinus JEL632]|nr:hypothetical protein BJ741DRAFT_602799 [Chytriomyces cf. hyalinus JEL632]
MNQKAPDNSSPSAINFTETAPTEVIQQIFSWIHPSQNVTLNLLNRRVRQCLSSISFATINLSRFIPSGNSSVQDVSLVGGSMPLDEFDLGLFLWPEEYQYALVAVKYKYRTRMIWETKKIRGRLTPALGEMKNAETLGLGQNQLTGQIPRELGQLQNLQYLNLSRNFLSGEIPSELGQLSNLWYLALNGCSLEGSIPKELGNLSKLETLYLGGNELSGRIPTELGQLSNLTSLHLNSNKLRGCIPPELGQLTNLKEFYLQLNKLEGGLPSELGGLSACLYFNVTGNLLSGPIPPEIESLNLLQFFQKGNDLNVPVEQAIRMINHVRQCDLTNPYLS